MVNRQYFLAAFLPGTVSLSFSELWYFLPHSSNMVQERQKLRLDRTRVGLPGSLANTTSSGIGHLSKNLECTPLSSQGGRDL